MFAIPDTAYFIVIAGGADGTIVGKKILYYKINSAGAVEFVGNYADRTDNLTVQFSPPNAAAQSVQAIGHILQDGVGSGPVAMRYPIAVTYQSGIGSNRASITLLPPINFILTGSVAWSASNPWQLYREAIFNTTSFFGSGILQMNDRTGGNGNVQSGFFLPRLNKGSYYCMMFFTEDLERHAAGTESVASAWLATHAAANVDGLISSINVRTQIPFLDQDPYPSRHIISNPVVNFDVNFDVFPFPDDKEDFAGNPGTALNNYYLNPTVLPLDKNDETLPWLLFFPRVYREAGDRDKIGLRIYQWDPVNERATFLAFAKGQVFNIGTDVDAQTNPGGCNVKWDRDTGELTLIVRGEMSGENNLIVTRFGTLLPEVTSSTAFVNDRHVDAVVGCNYRSRAQTLRPDFGAGARNGPGLGKLRRVDQYALLTFNTGPTLIGTDFDNLFDVEFENFAGPDAFGRDPLFSQVAHGALESTYDFDNFTIFEVRRPVPGAYVSVAGFSNTSDR